MLFVFLPRYTKSLASVNTLNPNDCIAPCIFWLRNEQSQFIYLQINYRIHWKRGITFYFGFVGCWSALALPLAVRHLRKRPYLLLPHPSFPSSHHYPRQTTMPRTSCGLCRHLCRRRWSTATLPTRSPDRRTWKVWTSTSSEANLKLHVNCRVKVHWRFSVIHVVPVST